MAEGGKLVIYAGGDVPSQQTATKAAFEAAFPNMTLDILVDYSKFQDARIDWQLANGKLQPDLITLQTIQDFPRWKAVGHLLQYKSANFSKIYREFNDENGFYMGISVSAFGYLANSNLLNASDFPWVAIDYLKPIFGSKKLAVTIQTTTMPFFFGLSKQLTNMAGSGWTNSSINSQSTSAAKFAP